MLTWTVRRPQVVLPDQLLESVFSGYYEIYLYEVRRGFVCACACVYVVCGVCVCVCVARVHGFDGEGRVWVSTWRSCPGRRVPALPAFLRAPPARAALGRPYAPTPL